MSLKLKKRRALLIYIAVIMFFLGACSSTRSRAPIRDASPTPSYKIQTHIVAKGDTVYSIAWRYGLDYKGLSRVNRLDSQYRIWPGQALNLNVPPSPTGGVSGANSGHVVSAKTSGGRMLNQSHSTPLNATPGVDAKAFDWVWPAKGEVISTFDQASGLNKGIDIRGNLGEPVSAAANGVVVYAGSGLRGYGKLLIVKHSDKILSAYAHNHAIHVGEGDKVKIGQKIAEVGFSGTQTTKLHFEIRNDGNPVDPLAYLPKR